MTKWINQNKFVRIDYAEVIFLIWHRTKWTKNKIASFQEKRKEE